MRNRRPFKVTRKKKNGAEEDRSIADIVTDLTKGGTDSNSYRQASLRMYGLICAKCGREFEGPDQHLLTVHHKDGNHLNNPPDGSNWENLCIDCHDDEHSRGLLGDYLKPD